GGLHRRRGRARRDHPRRVGQARARDEGPLLDAPARGRRGAGGAGWIAQVKPDPLLQLRHRVRNSLQRRPGLHWLRGPGAEAVQVRRPGARGGRALARPAATAPRKAGRRLEARIRAALPPRAPHRALHARGPPLRQAGQGRRADRCRACRGPRPARGGHPVEPCADLQGKGGQRARRARAGRHRHQGAGRGPGDRVPLHDGQGAVDRAGEQQGQEGLAGRQDVRAGGARRQGPRDGQEGQGEGGPAANRVRPASRREGVMAARKTSYTAQDIQVLEGLEPVRKRPAMYIGGTDTTGYHHLLWEILDNSVDEVINGYAARIDVTLHKDGKTVTVVDDGRGIPIDMMAKYKKPALEVILTTLHSGGKFEQGNYIHSGGLHGVGASVVNALSSSLIARVKRDGKRYLQTYAKGLATSRLKSE